MEQNMAPTSNKNEVIVTYQLFHRISLANGLVARMSSFPVSMHKFKEHCEIIITECKGYVLKHFLLYVKPKLKKLKVKIKKYVNTLF